MYASILAFALLLTAASTPALAQRRTPPVEIFAGYSVLPADRNHDFPRTSASHGVQFGASFSLSRWFGLFADLGVHQSTHRDLGPGFRGLVARTRVTEFLAGPRFVARSERVSVSGHGLVGWVRGDAGDFTGFSDTELAFGGGIGVDVPIGERLGIRGQFDLLGSFADIVEGNTRFAVGIVIGLGRS